MIDTRVQVSLGFSAAGDAPEAFSYANHPGARSVARRGACGQIAGRPSAEQALLAVDALSAE